MPGLDKTGRNGEGAKTGRGLGICNDKPIKTPVNNVNDIRPSNRGTGRGIGQNLGRKKRR